MTTRIGEFSTIYIPTPSNASIPQLMYLVYFDPCTVPFAFTVLTSDGHEYTSDRYTDTKNDSLIPTLKRSNERNESGLHLNVRNIDHVTYDVTLHYIGQSISRVVLRDVYDTQIGRVCPVHECSKSRKNPLDKLCSVPWVDFDNKIRKCQITVHFRPCAVPIKTQIEIRMVQPDKYNLPYFPKEQLLPFMENIEMVSSRDDKWQTSKDPTRKLKLGYKPAERPDTPYDGYLPLDSGWLSAYVHHHEERQQIDLMVCTVYTAKKIYKVTSINGCDFVSIFLTPPEMNKTSLLVENA